MRLGEEYRGELEEMSPMNALLTVLLFFLLRQHTTTLHPYQEREQTSAPPAPFSYLKSLSQHTMKGIRRSLNKDKIGAPSPSQNTVSSTSGYSSVSSQQTTPKPSSSRSTTAPAPPKRVIRAISSYRAAGPKELSFQEGDFFHVVSENGGDDWFDAANPMTGARGHVPASHFQVLGRNVRDTAQAAVRTPGAGAQPSPGYAPASFSQQQQQQQQRAGSSSNGQQSGFVPTGAPMQSTFVSPPISPPVAPSSHHSGSSAVATSRSRPPSQPAPKSQPLYGIVQYDFVAERADELDAKRGEPIIVIAQSNHEWFVAKPIGRLGGPGLIPVAFVEIQDMATGKPVENVEELIRSAVVPKVEEWKKMTADYKSASIPLGRFDFADNPPPVSNSSFSNPPESANPYSNPSGSASGSSIPGQQQSAPYDAGASYSNSNPALVSPAGSSQHSDSHRHSGHDTYDSDPPVRTSYTLERERYGLVSSASVESFHYEEGSFWFHLRASFTKGASLVLYRLYSDFYEFQISLMDTFPVEAGRIPPGGEGSGRPLERILPMMPGPTDFEDETVCAQRVHDLSIYLADVCLLPERIRSSNIMYDFFVLRAGDVEIDQTQRHPDGHARGSSQGTGNGNEAGMSSIDGQYGELVEYLDSMDGPGSGRSGGSGQQEVPDVGGLRLEEEGGEDYGGNTYRPSGQQRQSGSGNSGYSDGRGSSGDQHSQREDYSAQQQTSYQSTYPSSQSPSPQVPPLGNANQNVPFVKIKIFHRNTDDLIAIRVPPTVTHSSLLDKVRERLGGDVVNLRYREEVGSGAAGSQGGGQVIMAGGARLIGIESDQDLERWIRGGSRLVLYAD